MDYKEQIQQSGLTVNEVATRCGIATATLSRIINGKQNPSTKIIDRLTVALSPDSGQFTPRFCPLCGGSFDYKKLFAHCQNPKCAKGFLVGKSDVSKLILTNCENAK